MSAPQAFDVRTRDWGSTDAAVISRLLLYGEPSTRQAMADAVADGDETLASLLAATARSDEAWALRARCVEVLGRALATAGPKVSRSILTTLMSST